MSPLFQLQLLIPFNCLDESLIPTGFIQLFIPMAALIWSHFLFNNWFYSTTVLFNCLFTVPYSNCFIQPDGRPLILFNFLFRWPPLFGHTFYSTTGFIQQLFYSNAYSLSLIPTVLFNSCSLDESLIPTGFIQLFIPMAALIWSHFLFNFLFLFNLNGRPYLVALFLFLFNLNGRPYLVTLILFYFIFYSILFYFNSILFNFFFFFFFGKKGVLPGFEPGTS